MTEECPSPSCRIDIIKCLNRKVSKAVLGTSLGLLIAAASTLSFIVYSAYDNARDALATEATKAKTLAETNRVGLSEARSDSALIKQSLEAINDRLREMKSDQKEVNKQVLKSLEELKEK